MLSSHASKIQLVLYFDIDTALQRTVPTDLGKKVLVLPVGDDIIVKKLGYQV